MEERVEIEILMAKMNMDFVLEKGMKQEFGEDPSTMKWDQLDEDLTVTMFAVHVSVREHVNGD